VSRLRATLAIISQKKLSLFSNHHPPHPFRTSPISARWSDTASEAALSSLSNIVTFCIKRPSGRANRGRYLTYRGISASHRPLFVGSIHLFLPW
jgi:hypothetical protein